jgi:starvation-inducible DNA-binding protein
MTARDAKSLRVVGPLATPTDLQPNAVRDLAGALNILLADVFALYLKTKNFHWHVSGPQDPQHVQDRKHRPG